MSKRTPYRLSTRSDSNAEGVDPRLLEILHLAIQITLVDFGVPADGGVRTDERQHELFTDGNSGADGYVKISNHQEHADGYGKALDFYAYVDGAASWQRAHLAMVATAFFQAASILGHRITWGGLWESKKPRKTNGIAYGWDMPHIELLED